MARAGRIVVAGEPHHVTQRGNNRADVFFSADDRLMYLNLLREACAAHGVQVHAYCLMTNHVHHVVTPSTEDALATVMHRVHHAYALFVNERRDRHGHLWQSRFYSCPLDEEHFWQAMRYVECNPVRAGLVSHPWEYRWSSAVAHVAHRGSSRLLDLAVWRARLEPEVWRATLAAIQSAVEVEGLRRHTYTGRPLGSEPYLKRLEAQFSRRLRPLPPGRPRTKC